VAEDPITRSEAIVLIDSRIKIHQEDVNQPQHIENKTVLKELIAEVKGLRDTINEMKVTQAIVMKFAAGGVVVWSIKQIVELIKTLQK